MFWRPVRNLSNKYRMRPCGPACDIPVRRVRGHPPPDSSRSSAIRCVFTAADSTPTPVQWLIADVVGPGGPVSGAASIPQRTFPAVDPTLVAADWALPRDVAGRAIQLGNDLAETSLPTRAARARDVRVPVSLGRWPVTQATIDPKKSNRFKRRDGNCSGTFTGLLIEVVLHVDDPAPRSHRAPAIDAPARDVHHAARHPTVQPERRVLDSRGTNS